MFSPKPDVLVFNTNQCRDVQDWMYFYHKHFDVPMMGVNTPVKVTKVTDVHVDAVAKQIEAMVEPLTKISGKKFDYDKFKEVVGISKRLTENGKPFWKRPPRCLRRLTFSTPRSTWVRRS